MVGNDYEKDIVPAKAVGIHTILFIDESKSVLFSDADFMISSMNELYEVINSIDKKNFVG
jgi:FMN phosphatase YigB (HAD superfamily)